VHQNGAVIPGGVTVIANHTSKNFPTSQNRRRLKPAPWLLSAASTGQFRASAASPAANHRVSLGVRGLDSKT